MPAALTPSDAGFGLYVHWPFCLSKCPYCDFNSHVAGSIDQARWRSALVAELDNAAAEAPRAPLSSIFFGGGTPSLMDPATVEAVIDRAAALFGLTVDVEVTLEANPTSVEARRFADYRAAGVNRLSLGVQALDDAALKALGRGHSAREALAAIDLARRNFPRFSFDLIYARPDQTLAIWRDELDRALALAGDHLSLYQLTIEKGTPYYALHRDGGLVLPEEATAEALYELTGERLARAGLLSYEVSNYARPGAESRHNLVYWRYGDYLGIGPGAHGRLRRDDRIRATRRWRAPERWLAAVETAGHGLEADEALSPRDATVEALMMGLRLAEGIDRRRFLARTGIDVEAAVDAAALARLIEGGFLTSNATTLAATPAGLRVLNSVLSELIPD
jgi:oxygen-independent coproporphyrinogen-3 oxidase